MDRNVLVSTALKALYKERSLVGVILRRPNLVPMAQAKRQADHDRITATIEWLTTLQEEVSHVG